MKRFYTDVTTAALDEGGHQVLLDGKVVRTPAKAPLIVPTAAVAEAIGAEWSAQGEAVDLNSMPLTRHACAAIDRVKPHRQLQAAEVAHYAKSDLICYRATQPEALRQRQDDGWGPILAWIAETYGADFKIGEGVEPVEQPYEAVQAIKDAVEAYDDLSLVALHTLTTIGGSVLIALAVARGRLEADAAFDLSQIDETFQIEHWGDDPEWARRRDHLRGLFLAAERLLRMMAAAD